MNLENVYCIIMAGGKGERFWPLSTGSVPKPFLKLTGEKTLIQLTVERALQFVPEDKVFIVLGNVHLAVARRQLPQLPAGNFIVEPSGRDTAACVGLAAISLPRQNDDSVMIMLPADQYVPDVKDFAETMEQCVGLARTGDWLVTLGIRPSRPETGYGYIHAVKEHQSDIKGQCFNVEKYVEKPDMERAVAYLADGHYYWNGGIFIWRTKAILEGLKEHMPVLYEGLCAMESALHEGKKNDAEDIFERFEKKSIDYGLMEKAGNVLMVPAHFVWDDVGTWASLPRVLDIDEKGNYVRGDSICIDTTGSVIVAETGFVAAVGVSDLVVVSSENGVLVCHKDRVQDVREIVKRRESVKK